MEKMKRWVLVCIFVLLSGGYIFGQSSFDSPKNIILFISDGCGANQIMATDFYQHGATGDVQVYQNFPVQNYMSTFMAMNKNSNDEAYGMEGGYAPHRAWEWFDYVKKKPTDSAASGTALATGKKTYKYAIGIDVNGEPLENIIERADKLEKSTGVVTSVEWSHATPASFVAHNKTRNNYEEIATEMLNSGLDVIMGAGHPWFDKDGKAIESANTFKYVGGEDTWNALKEGTFGDWTLLEEKSAFENLTTGDTPTKVVGTAQVYQTLQQKRSGDTASDNTTDAPYTDAFIENVPSLRTMTQGAINVLDNNPNGFFLMVEGGAIDWAGHDNTTARMIEEEICFNYAVEAAVEWVEENSSWDETLIIVTGDHETGYLTGPDAGPDNKTEGSTEPTFTDPVNNGVGILPTTEWHSGDHTNSLIPLFAKGPGSNLLAQHADEYDVQRGYYLTNSEVGQAMLQLWPDFDSYIMPPKNIVLMISDGCGANQIIAANCYQYGEPKAQAYEDWPTNMFMSTFMALGYDGDHEPNLDEPQGGYEPNRSWSWFDYHKKRPTDSAASATAFSTGLKTYKYSMGLDAQGNSVKNIIELAEEKGKATGSISSVHWTHATPAAMVAHNKDRNQYDEIGAELVNTSKLDVLMGAGHPWYDDNNVRRSKATALDKVGGEETWNALTAGTAGNDADGDGIDDMWTLIESKELFEKLTEGPTPKRVLGTAMAATTLQEKRSGVTNSTSPTDGPYTDPLNAGVPDLPTMSKAALNILDNDEDGFFLMIEGGAIDWAGHSNFIVRSIEEEIDFNKSVDAVIEWVETNSSWDETLVIVTGDHETGYLTGPGSGTDGADEKDKNDVWTEPVNNGQGNLPDVEYHSGDHTNQLIPLFAKGAGSTLFSTYADQYDERRGYFTDNAEVGQIMQILMGMNPVGDYIVSETSTFELVSVKDVEGDQGKQIRVTWSKHPLEQEGQITQYNVFRMKTTDALAQNMDEEWELMTEVPASNINYYTSIVSSEKDSTITFGAYDYLFYVKALTADDSTFFDSEQMIGYSKDNVAPKKVRLLKMEYTPEGNRLYWRDSRDDDFSHYNVYKSSDSQSVVSEETLVLSTNELEYLDTEAKVGDQFFYVVAAVDSSGNIGDYSVMDVITGVETKTIQPFEFTLHQNYPNPFNPITNISYTIPKTAEVKLTIYNTLGQIVKTLVDQKQSAGQYKVQWDGLNHSSGIYLYKLQAGDKTFIKKMQLLK